MKKLLLLALILASLAVTAQAQTRRQPPMDFSSPSVELYGGYSYMNIDGAGGVSRQHSHGWAGSISGNFHRNVGFVGDFGGHYGHVDFPGIGTAAANSLDFRVHEALLGPRFFQRFDQATAFFHTLFGVVDTRIPHGPVVLGSSRNPFVSGQSRTDFAFAIGGGVDYNVSRGVAIRLFQLDYLPVRSEPMMHNIRGSFGVVLKLGR